MRTLQFGLAAVASVAVISTAVLALWLVGSATGDRERFSSLGDRSAGRGVLHGDQHRPDVIAVAGGR